MTKEKKAFREHKNGAKRRGIEFCFTFEEWVNWWEINLGPTWLQKRGIRLGQYCMARNNDLGPYHPDNVKCLTCSENHTAVHPTRFDTTKIKLTATQAKDIYLMGGSQEGIARKYNISSRLVRLIKSKQAWQRIHE
jgi:hypothetical protein